MVIEGPGAVSESRSKPEPHALNLSRKSLCLDLGFHLRKCPQRLQSMAILSLVVGAVLQFPHAENTLAYHWFLNVIHAVPSLTIPA